MPSSLKFVKHGIKRVPPCTTEYSNCYSCLPSLTFSLVKPVCIGAVTLARIPSAWLPERTKWWQKELKGRQKWSHWIRCSNVGQTQRKSGREGKRDRQTDRRTAGAYRVILMSRYTEIGRQGVRHTTAHSVNIHVIHHQNNLYVSTKKCIIPRLTERDSTFKLIHVIYT